MIFLFFTLSEIIRNLISFFISYSPTFDKFMQDWAFQNAPVKAEPKPEPIEPMTTGQTIAVVLFLIALFSAISTVAGYALLGAIEVLR